MYLVYEAPFDFFKDDRMDYTLLTLHDLRASVILKTSRFWNEHACPRLLKIKSVSIGIRITQFFVFYNNTNDNNLYYKVTPHANKTISDKQY